MQQVTSEQIFAVCDSMSLDEKAKLVKQLLSDSNVLLYLVGFFDKEQIAVLMRAIAHYIASSNN